MASSNKLLKSTAVLTVGRVAGYGLSFGRNLILARVLSKADFGLSAVFAMAMLLLEVGGRMGFDVQIVQSKDGDSPRFQATAQSVQLLAGFFSATLLAVVSVPISHVFKVPHAWWAFLLLALIPISQGLSHLDTARVQRQLNYLPLVLVDVVPQLTITLAAWPVAGWLGDYRCIVVLMLSKAFLSTVLSFVLAERKFRCAWDPVQVRHMLNFGWPLLVTGLLMFGSQQLDQMLVGAAFTLEVLANYSLAFTLVAIPWFVLGQVMSSLMLPLMARSQSDPETWTRQYNTCAGVAAVAGCTTTVPLIICGEQLITAFYGIKYQGCGVFMALLGAAMTIRFLRFAPAVAAIARGDTINQLFSNAWRITSLPLALILWRCGGAPEVIAASAIFGETLALFASAVMLRKRQSVPLRSMLHAALYTLLLIVPAVAFAFLGAPDRGVLQVLSATVGALAVSIGLGLLFFPSIAKQLGSRFRHLPDAATGPA